MGDVVLRPWAQIAQMLKYLYDLYGNIGFKNHRGIR
jgi:hypothetical protein